MYISLSFNFKFFSRFLIRLIYIQSDRIAAHEAIDDTAGMDMEKIIEMQKDKEAKARATILEIVGDIPDADIAPPENVLFVCKLNPVTNDDDLEIIFSRFGQIVGYVGMYIYNYYCARARVYIKLINSY